MIGSPTATFAESANSTAVRLDGGFLSWMTARSVVESVPTTSASYRSPLLSVTTMLFAPETTWLFVTMWPSLSMIAPEPFASPSATVVEIETTAFETFDETAVQSGAAPPSTTALPSEPLWFDEETDDIDVVVGTFTQP